MTTTIMTTSTFSMGIMLLASIIGAYGALLLKRGVGKWSFARIWNTDLFSGVLAYCIALLMNIVALRSGELSALYPLSSATYIWVTLFSKYKLRETINAWKILGILFIIAGVTLIGVSV